MQWWESFDFEDKRLVLNRNEAPEEVFVTLTYSPVPGNIFDESPNGLTIERGEAGGVLVTVTETTGLVRAHACEAERALLKEALAEQALRKSENRFRQALEFKHRVRARNREGGWLWLKSHAMPWFTASGEYAGYVGISLDITEAVNSETALLEADRHKDEFLATLAHELRTPLAPIVNALTLIA